MVKKNAEGCNEGQSQFLRPEMQNPNKVSFLDKVLSFLLKLKHVEKWSG